MGWDVTGDRTPPADRIRLLGLAATGYHGVFEHERREGQTFVADVVVHVDTRPAAAADRLDLTVDYGTLAAQVTAVLEGEPADLVETVAERIAAVALTPPAVQAVEVVLHKPQAPVPVPFSDVTVEIVRDREHRPPVLAVRHPESEGEPDGPAAPPVPPAVPPVPPVPAPPPPAMPEPPSSHPAPGTGRLDQLEPPAAPDAVLDRVPDAPVDVVLALGSNVGASHETLRRAVADLGASPGVEVAAIAPLARTAAVGGPEQPDFLNTVVLARTTLSPRGLLRVCQDVEQHHGRERHEHWGPRTLDVDVITYGGLVAAADDLELPHPRAHQRAFVLQPWAQVDPGAFLPGLGGGPVAALAGTAADREGIRWMALDWWRTPEAG